MKRITIALAGGLLAALSLNAVASQGASQYHLNVPIVELNNPCTAGHDSIDGSLDLHAVTQHSGGITFLKVTGKGKGVDASGVKYNLGATAKFRFHDPLPAQVYIKLRLISQGSGDNASAVLALHVNEQGIVTQAVFSGVECRG